MTTDSQVVEAIRAVAENFGLRLERQNHGGSFCTVTLRTPSYAPTSRHTLRIAQANLISAGVSCPTLAAVTNPDHPEYGQPYLEIDSVWWPE